MYQWNDLKEKFETDGSLRDIYIVNITVTEWDKFIDYTKLSKYKFEFTHGAISIEVPRNFSLIKELQETESTTLSIWLNEKIQLNCHFFIENEIELDLSPYDISSEIDFELLLQYLENLAHVLKNRVILTYEGVQEQIILSCGGQFV